MTVTDETLMMAVREGDLEKLSVLFERYHMPLFSFFSHMGRSPANGDDLVQDVFFRILKYRRTFRSGSRFRVWMYQIARNARLQDFQLLQGIPVPLTNDVAVSPRTDSPVDRLERDQDAALVRCALQKVADEKRELLVLVWYQEMKYDEIAELLGIEVGAVKVRVHRAMKDLRAEHSKLLSEKTPCNVKTFRTI